MFFQQVTLFRRLLRHSVPRNDKLVFQKSGEELNSGHIDNINIMGIFKKAEVPHFLLKFLSLCSRLITGH